MSLSTNSALIGSAAVAERLTHLTDNIETQISSVSGSFLDSSSQALRPMQTYPLRPDDTFFKTAPSKQYLLPGGVSFILLCASVLVHFALLMWYLA